MSKFISEIGDSKHRLSNFAAVCYLQWDMRNVSEHTAKLLFFSKFQDCRIRDGHGKTTGIIILGPVVQNFVSLMLSLSPKFVNYISTSKANTLLFFVEKIVRILCIFC